MKLKDIQTPKRLTYFSQVIDDYGCDRTEYVWVPEGDEFIAPNLVSSEADDGYHYPALDIDIPMRVVPSSTPGHSHLYFDELKLTWTQYQNLLIALSDAGILEQRYVEHSFDREATYLRLPHIRKVAEVSYPIAHPGNDVEVPYIDPNQMAMFV